MHRTLFAILLVAVAPAWAAADDPKKPDYFPLAKGNKWDYEMKIGDEKRRFRHARRREPLRKRTRQSVSAEDPHARIRSVLLGERFGAERVDLDGRKRVARIIEIAQAVLDPRHTGLMQRIHFGEDRGRGLLEQRPLCLFFV